MSSDYDFLLKKQVSIIRDAIDVMLKNAKYGNHQDFLQNIRRINDATSKMEVQMNTGVPLPTRRKYHKILVPYDNSKYSKKALIEAIDIAKELGSEVHIVNVMSAPTDQSPTIIQDRVNKSLKKLDKNILRSQMTQTNKILQEKMTVCKKQGVNVSCDVVPGKPVESILKFARENEIDLIIVGSRGLTRLNKLMALGSVSRRIAEEAKCPVMIVR